MKVEPSVLCDFPCKELADHRAVGQFGQTCVLYMHRHVHISNELSDFRHIPQLLV